jgi:hypothetical protein
MPARRAVLAPPAEAPRNRPHPNRGCRRSRRGGSLRPRVMGTWRPSGGARHAALVDGFPARPHRRGLEIILTEIGGCRPPRREGASKSSSPRSGSAGWSFTTAPGAGARSTCAWRSIFWKAKTSPGKITTASVHVAPVQRSLPPSTRSTVTVNPLSHASGHRGAGRRIAARCCAIVCWAARINRKDLKDG